MTVLETALLTRLTTTSALTALLADAASVYNTRAKRGAAFNYVVFSLQAGGPTNQSPRRAESLVYLVKAVATGAAAAAAIDDQVDAALHNLPLTVSGWSNYWLMRESRVSFAEETGGGAEIWHTGGLYRVRLGT